MSTWVEVYNDKYLRVCLETVEGQKGAQLPNWRLHAHCISLPQVAIVLTADPADSKFKVSAEASRHLTVISIT